MPSLTKVQPAFILAQGAIELDSGTASAPSLKFSTSSATGMFSPSTGALAFSTGSTQNALTILSGGNVGIGTTNPSEKLHVLGTGFFSSRLTSGQAIIASNESIDPDSFINKTLIGAIADGSGWGVSSAVGGNAGTGDSWAIGHNGGALFFGMQNGTADNTMQTYMQFEPSRNIVLVPTSGNVGIGTTNPSTKLDVVGSIIASGSVSAAGASGFYSTTFVTNARNPIWRFANADGYGLSYFQGSSGVSPAGGGDTIGFHFGTPTAAASLLQLNNSSGVVINGTLGVTGEISGSSTVRTNNNKLVLRDDSIENHATDTDGAAIVLNYVGYNAGTTRFRDFYVYNGKSALILRAVGSSGNIGIGTTNPTSKLEVVGTVTATNFADATGGYNINLGSNTIEGRGLVAGYSGGSYGGIGYNVRHTTTGGVWIAPSGDTSSYLLFTQGGFAFYGAGSGAAGRTLSYSTLATLNSSGNLSLLGATHTANGNTIWHAGNDGAGSGLDADLLDGMSTASGNVGATVVVRDGAGSFSANAITATLVGNASSATTFSTNRTNYSGVTDGAVAGQLMWKNYGNNHTLFDASAGTSPQGSAVDRFTPAYLVDNATGQNGWGYSINLMGWNGNSTYGVRVDYSRVASNLLGYSGTYWTSNNDGAGSGLDADLLDGLQLHTGTNNEANKVVRTDGNGYIQAGWINTTSGGLGVTTRLDRVYTSNDGYIRYLGLTDFKNQMGLSSKNSYSRAVDYTSNSDYWVGSFGHSGYGANETFHGGSGFFDIWGGTNYPSGFTHIHGINMLHYTTNSLGSTGGVAYGWQLTTQYDSDAGPYWRRCNAGGFSNWRKIWHDTNDGAGSGLDADLLDGNNSSYFLDTSSTTQTKTGRLNIHGDFLVAVNGTTANHIVQRPYTINNGTLSWEGSAGQLFSITNNLTTGSIFSVNDVSGIPSIDVDANGTIELAPFSGNVGVGTTNPTTKLHVIGDILASGNVTAYSDSQLKDNVETIDKPLEKVLGLRGVTFTRVDIEDKDKKHIGVIAQEVEQVLPEVVLEHSDGIKSVAYGNMVGLLIEAIKEQQNQIESLKAEIESLKRG